MAYRAARGYEEVFCEDCGGHTSACQTTCNQRAGDVAPGVSASKPCAWHVMPSRFDGLSSYPVHDHGLIDACMPAVLSSASMPRGAYLCTAGVAQALPLHSVSGSDFTAAAGSMVVIVP